MQKGGKERLPEEGKVSEFVVLRLDGLKVGQL